MTVAGCPYCGETLTEHENMGTSDRGPSLGALSLCWHCNGLAVFDAGPLGRLRLRVPTTEESAEIHADARLQRALRATADAIRREVRR